MIFDPVTAPSLLQQLAGCVNGYAVYRETSFLANKLGDAHKRGVTVQVVVDADSRSTGLDTLKTRLADPAGSPDSWVRTCKPEEACLALDLDEQLGDGVEVDSEVLASTIAVELQ